jgi:parallel beta-helix repeat protein
VRKALLIACALLAMLPSLASATTYYVRKTGNDTTGDGSTGTPWLTVSKALLTISIAGGHTVNIGDGTYSEDTSGTTYFYVNRFFLAEVIFQSESGVAANVILQGSASAAFDVRLDRASHVTFKNLSLIPRLTTNTSAVKGNGGPLTYIRFDGCVFSIEATNGIAFDQTVASVSGLDNISFVNCTFVQTGANDVYGLRILALSGWNATNILISGCSFTFVGVSRPIQIKPSPATTGYIQNLTIENTTVLNEGGTFAYGIQLDGIITATITNVTSTTTAAGAIPFIIGIDGDVALWPSSGITITGGTFTNTITHGLLIGAGVNGATMTGAKVIGGDDGIVLKACSNVVARGNIVTTNSGQGLYLKGTTNSVFEDNTVVNLDSGEGLGVHLAIAVQTAGSGFIRNRVIVLGTANIYGWDAAADAGGNFSNCNTFAILGSGSFGVILTGAPQTTLAGVRAAWVAGGYPENDSRSRDARVYQAPGGLSLNTGGEFVRYYPAPDCTR